MRPFPTWLKIALAAIILCGLWWRVEIFAHRDWGTDEGSQYKITSGPLKPFWLRASYGELHSFPGNYLLTFPFVHIFKTNKFGVAIPLFISTLFGFFFLVQLCRRYLQHPLSWLLTFIIYAMHTQLIFHALELRPYSILATLGLSSFYLMENLLNPSIPVADRSYPLYFIYLILVIAFHPYGLIIIAFCGSFFFLKNIRQKGFWEKLKKHRIFWVLALILGLPLWVYYSISPYSMHIPPQTVFQFIPNPIENFPKFFTGVVGNLLGNRIFYIFLTGICIRCFFPFQGRLDTLFFLGWFFVLPIALILYADVKSSYWFLQKQFIWLSALFPLFLGSCWDGIFLSILKKP